MKNYYNKEKKKSYYQENKEKILEQRKKYYEENKEAILEKNSKRRKTEESREKWNKYISDRKKNDNLFMLKDTVRKSISKSFKRKTHSKNNKSVDILGCSFDFFKVYIEEQFKDWMTWENHGLYNGDLNYGWDLDHIIPLASATTEEEIIKLNHYTNFQPLCSCVNRHIKKDKLNYE